MPRLTALTACVLALLLRPGAAQAQPVARLLTPDDGLSSAVTSAVARDAEGFLWVGTQSGADRYDGARVRAFGTADGLPDSYVRALHTDPTTGTLWAGTDRGLARYDATRERFVPVGAPDAVGPVLVLASVGGTVWAGTERGLLRLGSRPRGFRQAGGALAGDTVTAVVGVPGRRQLLVATTGGLTRLDPESGRGRHTTAGDVTAMAVVGRTVWVGTASGRVRPIDAETLRPVGPTIDVGAPVNSLAPSRTATGRLWVGTEGAGVWQVETTGARGPTRTATAFVGSQQTTVTGLTESDGLLWIATTSGVVSVDLAPRRFETLGTDALDGVAVLSLLASSRSPETVWIGTHNGGLRRDGTRGGRAGPWFSDPSHPLHSTYAIVEVEDGALWLGGLAPALYRFTPSTGGLREVPLGLDGYVTSLVPSRAFPGQLWVTTMGAGVHLVDAARAARVRDAPGAGALADVGDAWTVLEPEGRPGTLYVATDGRGLLRLDLTTGRLAPVEPECAMGASVVSLASGPDGSLWAAGFEPWLVRLRPDGTCQRYTDADGVPSSNVGWIAVDRAGHVWLSATGELARLDPEAGVFTSFDESDGLPQAPRYFHAHDRTPAGELLIGGADGFVRFRPEAVPVDETPAPVRITRVLVDGEPVPLADALGGLVLAHDRNDLAVEFAALDLRQPEKNRYRVRLVGADDGWRPTGPETRYPLLPPGRYTLQVAASNRDGYWSAPTELAVRIRPPVWQRPWFWVLVAGAVAGVGLAAHRYRVAQLLRVERTRRRIADDLHDDIGSKISSVALRLDAARRSPALPDAERERLGRLGDTTRAVVADLRDTVWLVDAGHDDLRSVADRMEQFARQTLEGGRGHVERGPVPSAPLGMAARRDLYFLFTEALHNAVRHAEAGHVAVRIGCDGDVFRVEVADDGRGFDAEAAGAGRGMETMRRRADALGAALTVASAPGRGTRVSVQMPVRLLSRRRDIV